MQKTGKFLGQAIIESCTSLVTSQSLAPDNSALSILFDDFVIDTQGSKDSQKGKMVHFILPVSAVQGTRVLVHVRGGGARSGGGVCTALIATPTNVAKLKIDRSTNLTKQHLTVNSHDNILSFGIELHCKSGSPGGLASAWIDSLDLVWELRN